MNKDSQKSLKEALKGIVGRIDPEMYFYDVIPDTYDEFVLSDQTALDFLIKKSLEYVESSQCDEFFMFNDSIAGWKGLSKQIDKYDAFRINTNEVASVLVNNIFFRDENGYVDNYYVIDANMSFIIMFCHEGDWHVWNKR